MIEAMIEAMTEATIEAMTAAMTEAMEATEATIDRANLSNPKRQCLGPHWTGTKGHSATASLPG